MMSTESKLYTIAVGNIITGVYNYIVVSLPLDWRIVVIPMNSDVFSSARQGDVKWVRDGEVEHGIATPMGEIMFRLRVWPGYRDQERVRELRKAERVYEVTVSGHSARAYIYKKRYGLRSHRVLGIHLYCGVTDRTMLIEFIGGEGWVDRVLSTIGGSQCHV